MKHKFIFLFMILIVMTILPGCQDYKDIIALVDNPQGYEIIEEKIEYDKGHIENIYKNHNKYVFHVVGYDGYAGDVHVIILVDNDRLEKIVGYDIKETTNYGERAFKDSYINQFIGINVKESQLLIGNSKPKDDTDIIYVTGATRTSNVILNTVNMVILYCNAQEND